MVRLHQYDFIQENIMKRQIILLLLVSAAALTSCRSVVTPALHSYATECLGVGFDGSQTLRVWASGRNKSDAIEQAKKKAVYDVIFTGIQAGGGECDAFPVVNEANARYKYQEYFDRFFAKGGSYTKYVVVSNRKKSDIQHFKGNGSETVGVIVTVNRSALRGLLVNDNIIK